MGSNLGSASFSKKLLLKFAILACTSFRPYRPRGGLAGTGGGLTWQAPRFFKCLSNLNYMGCALWSYCLVCVSRVDIKIKKIIFNCAFFVS